MSIIIFTLRTLERICYALLIVFAVIVTQTPRAWILAAVICALFVLRLVLRSEQSWLPDRLLFALPAFWAVERMYELPLLHMPIMLIFAGMVIGAMLILLLSRLFNNTLPTATAPDLEPAMLISEIFLFAVLLGLRYLTPHYRYNDFVVMIWFAAAFFGSVPVSYAVFSVDSTGKRAGSVSADA